MEKLDELVLDKLADQIFAPDRLQAMMTALRKHIHSSKNGQQTCINELNRQIKQIEKKQENMWEAIENGMPSDDTFHVAPSNSKLHERLCSSNWLGCAAIHSPRAIRK